MDDTCTAGVFCMYMRTTKCTLQCRPTQQCILRVLKLLHELKGIHNSLPEGASLEGDTKERVEGIKVIKAVCVCAVTVASEDYASHLSR